MERSFGRETFDKLTVDLWSAFRWVRDRDPIRGTEAELFAGVTDEAALRELVGVFGYSLDAKDPQWTASLFSGDGHFLYRDRTDRGSVGREAIAAHCGELSETPEFSSHRPTNFIVRIMPGGTEAWLTAYLHVATVSGGEVTSQFGHYFGRFEKHDGRWYFADWCYSLDFVFGYRDSSGVTEADLPLDDPVDSLPATRSWAEPKNPPFNGGRESWLALRDDLWSAHHWLLDQKDPSLGPAEKLTRLVDEIAIREMLSNYAYAHDARDLAWSGSLFTDDAILYNEQQTRTGNAEVIRAFRDWNATMYLTFHRFSNPIIRFVPGGEEAWLLAYFHVGAVRFGRRSYTFGRYFSRFTKRSGRWQIADWRIAPDALATPYVKSTSRFELVEWKVAPDASVPLLFVNGGPAVEVAR